MGAIVTHRDESGHAASDWYSGLDFSGPLDPAGTIFAFLMALVGTVAVIVLTAAIIRIVGG